MTSPGPQAIPRTAEEMDKLKFGITREKTEETIEKACKQNERIENAQKMFRMFHTDEFKEFWRLVHDDPKVQMEGDIKYIAGNPFEKLDKLGNIQGGINILEVQEMNKEVIIQLSREKLVDVELLKANIKHL